MNAKRIQPIPKVEVEQKRSSLNEFLRHPLLLTIVSFVLTGILGTALTLSIGQQTKKSELARQERLDRKSAIQNLSRYIYERRVRAEMLASSIRRNASVEEIKDRKRQYDDIYVRWNTESQANLFLVRDVLGETEYTFIEDAIEFKLIGNAYQPLDACITKAYDLELATKNIEASQMLDQCSIKQLLTLSLVCGYAITDELYKLASGSTTRVESKQEIDRRCVL